MIRRGWLLTVAIGCQQAHPVPHDEEEGPLPGESHCPESVDHIIDLSTPPPGWTTSLADQRAELEATQHCEWDALGSFTLDLELAGDEVMVVPVENHERGECVYVVGVGLRARLVGESWEEAVIPTGQARLDFDAATHTTSWSMTREEFVSAVFPSSGATLDEQLAARFIGGWQAGEVGSGHTTVKLWPLDGDPVAAFSCGAE
mgnify:CR=1 FL=1